LGETYGSTKKHRGLSNKSERVVTDKKLIFALKTKSKTPTTPYVSCWRGETEEEKLRKRN